MDHRLKMFFRKTASRSKLFSGLYTYASKKKTEKAQALSDEDFLKRKFRENTGRELDLEHPQTFNEKLQWLKLHDHNPLYITMADKYAVKAYVAEKIGAEYVIPLLGGPWQSADEIDFDALPEQFVLKCNHDCGSVVVCTDKSTLDRAAVRKKLNEALKKNYFWVGREWPYKNIKPCIFAEKYMVDDSGDELKDYKFFCFNGEPRCMFIATERMKQGETKFDFFDMDFHHLPFTNGHPNADICPSKPETFEKMKELARQLSKGITHVRVDFYTRGSEVYFGELTFYHWGGAMPFDPPEWDRKMGDWIDLSGTYGSCADHI